jgi:hypothetical protein
MEEFLTQPDEPYLPNAMQNYARAIEKTLAEVPVVNGVVDLGGAVDGAGAAARSHHRSF